MYDGASIGVRVLFSLPEDYLLIRELSKLSSSGATFTFFSRKVGYLRGEATARTSSALPPSSRLHFLSRSHYQIRFSHIYRNVSYS